MNVWEKTGWPSFKEVIKLLEAIKLKKIVEYSVNFHLDFLHYHLVHFTENLGAVSEKKIP